MLVLPWQESVNPIGEQIAPCVANSAALRVFRLLLNRESKTIDKMKTFWTLHMYLVTGLPSTLSGGAQVSVTEVLEGGNYQKGGNYHQQVRKKVRKRQ